MSLQETKNGLYAYYTKYEIKRALKYYVPTHCQNIAPTLENNPDNQFAFVTRQLLIPFFINRNIKDSMYRDKFYIILAEAGMGKTTFMLNLYTKYAEKLADTDYQIKIFPLSFPNAMEQVEKIPKAERPNTILLLDAFDEDSDAIKAHQKRLHYILQKVADFKEVVFTCRTQFFPREEEESGETGLLKFKYKENTYQFRKLYLSPFNEEDIKTYLKKNYSFLNILKRKKAEKIVLHSPNLMVRPMLLRYIDDLIKSRDNYSSTYQIYTELIAKWIEREVQRRGTNKEKYRRDLYKFSREVAIDMYTHRKRRGGFVITDDELKVLAEQNNVDLGTLELKTRALLHMNTLHQCTFAHKSILEYFLVTEAFYNLQFAKQLDLSDLEQGEQLREEMFFEKAKSLFGRYKTYDSGKSKDFVNIKPAELEKIKHAALLKIDAHDVQVLRTFKSLGLLQINDIQVDVDQLDQFLYQNHLDLSAKGLTQISDLQFLTNLEKLDLSNNQITDLTPLKNLKRLKQLNLYSNKVKDISILSELPNLEEVNIQENPIDPHTSGNVSGSYAEVAL
ncbi:NACHT domain-containing protein [Microscilla marina]|uniref:Leucine Rich Repeat domain protein n=1 Tax=Microscilla marina ATCC 23134 TaxID=313606 RepID=A1ZS57_MICM2|nr:leucine-rich repeat domain-containing protein [Microscilla marina]EAY26780.1 leucine Rich Repeat domain protein [Microscilla marina ATCC 23134]